MALNGKEQRFIAILLTQDVRNATAAYREAWNSKATDKTVSNAAYQQMQRPEIREVLARFEDKLQERFEDLAVEDLTRMWTQIATLDRNELTQLRRVCCRYCHGQGFRYQETPAELERRREDWERDRDAYALKAGSARGFKKFDPKGGVGYDRRKDPHPDCPECWGEGIEVVHFNDTRKLSPGAKAVYEGVEQTINGTKLRMFSRA